MITLTVRGGRVEFIYADGVFCDLIGGRSGAGIITRASHVEPSEGGGWTADLGPSGGPVLGPFERRVDALDAEVAWLKEHRGL